MKHFESTQKLQDELFRLKREESDNAFKLDKNFHGTAELQQKKVDEKLLKLETLFDQLKVKVDHEIPKQVVKVSTKIVNKTEKKLVSLLKD